MRPYLWQNLPEDADEDATADFINALPITAKVIIPKPGLVQVRRTPLQTPEPLQDWTEADKLQVFQDIMYKADCGYYYSDLWIASKTVLASKLRTTVALPDYQQTPHKAPYVAIMLCCILGGYTLVKPT